MKEQSNKSRWASLSTTQQAQVIAILVQMVISQLKAKEAARDEDYPNQNPG